MRAVDVRAVVNVEDMHGSGVLVDAVDDPVRAPPRAVAALERPEQRLADRWVNGEL
jgi:hypothetical protein